MKLASYAPCFPTGHTRIQTFPADVSPPVLRIECLLNYMRVHEIPTRGKINSFAYMLVSLKRLELPLPLPSAQ